MKNVVVTGSSSGFGYFITLTLARAGYKVWATMRDPHGKNKAGRLKLETMASREKLAIRVEELDVTSDHSVQKLADTVLGTDAKLDVLINNAGIMYVGITEAFSLKQARQQFETNFFGIIRTTKAFLGPMREAGAGLIVNISSLAGRLVFPYFGIYCATKFALEAYSEALRYELRPLGVDVCIVEPGPFPTGLLYSGPSEADKEILEGYGDMRGVPGALLENFDSFFKSADAPDPRSMANDVLNLVEMPRGQRPTRQVSGIDYGTVELNKRVLPLQEKHVRDNLQMGHLL